MTFRDWLGNGWAQQQETSPREIADLLAICDRDLKDAGIARLSADARMSIAYNAALQCATAAVRAAGCRLTRERHHERTIESLKYTLGLDGGVIAHLQAFRQKRNVSGYDAAGRVSDQEAAEMYDLATELRRMLLAWLKASHPALLTLRYGSEPPRN